MPPIISFNFLSYIFAVIVSFAFGGLWYGPLFGKQFMAAIGMKEGDCMFPDHKSMKIAYLSQVASICVTVFVLSYFVQIIRPSVWNLGAQDKISFFYGLKCAFIVWIGFYVPIQLGKVNWEKRPWNLFYINVSHDFINLLLVCQILAHWREG